jgi:hypothetical protein
LVLRFLRISWLYIQGTGSLINYLRREIVYLKEPQDIKHADWRIISNFDMVLTCNLKKNSLIFIIWITNCISKCIIIIIIIRRRRLLKKSCFYAFEDKNLVRIWFAVIGAHFHNGAPCVWVAIRAALVWIRGCHSYSEGFT